MRETAQTAGGMEPGSSEASHLLSEVSRSKGRFGSPRARRCMHQVVHTQGGAHTRRSVATARVLLFKDGVEAGPRIEQSEPERG